MEPFFAGRGEKRTAFVPQRNADGSVEGDPGEPAEFGRQVRSCGEKIPGRREGIIEMRNQQEILDIEDGSEG